MFSLRKCCLYNRNFLCNVLTIAWQIRKDECSKPSELFLHFVRLRSFVQSQKPGFTHEPRVFRGSPGSIYRLHLLLSSSLRAAEHVTRTKRKWGDREGGSGRWPGNVMSTKVIFRRAEVFVLAEVCLPIRPHAVLPRSQVLSEQRKWWGTSWHIPRAGPAASLSVPSFSLVETQVKI